MTHLYPGSGSVVQTAFYVPDLESAMSQWQRTAGVGPFFVFREVTLDVTYRGTASQATLSIGLAQLGGVHVELIQQHNDGPSVYRDVYPGPGDGGFHHVATVVPDVGAARDFYVAQGFDIAMELNFGDTPVIYVDTRPAIGCMTEVLRDDKPIVDLYALVKDSAVDWDGLEPIRLLPS